MEYASSLHTQRIRFDFACRGAARRIDTSVWQAHDEVFRAREEGGNDDDVVNPLPATTPAAPRRGKGNGVL